MRKVFLLIAFIASVLTTQAKDIWTGNHAVTWDNTIKIEAANFADVNVGDMLTINFTAIGDGDVIEIKSSGKWLPGSRFFRFWGADTKMDTYITADMLEAILQREFTL